MTADNQNDIAVSYTGLSRYFKRYEFACKCGCGFDVVDAELLSILIDLRAYFGNVLVTISSGCRCLEYNESVQKRNSISYIPYSSKSKHMLGKAVDIYVEGFTPEQVYGYLDTKYPRSYGLGKY